MNETKDIRTGFDRTSTSLLDSFWFESLRLKVLGLLVANITQKARKRTGLRENLRENLKVRMKWMHDQNRPRPTNLLEIYAFIYSFSQRERWCI